VTVKGFKSIVEQSIELGQINLLIGANGSGKTALLEAIGVLGAAADGRVDDAELLRRGVRPGVPKLYKSAFADLNRIPRVILLRADSRANEYYQVGLDNRKDSSSTPWRFSSETIGDERGKWLSRSPRGANLWTRSGRASKEKLTKLDPLVGLARERRLFGSEGTRSVHKLLGTLRNFAIFDPQTSILRGTQADLFQRDPIGLGGGRLAEALAYLAASKQSQVLQDEFEALVDWASSVSTAAPTPDLISPSIPVMSEVVRFSDRFMRDDRNELSAYDASEGALYVLFALAMILHPRSPRFFAIENIGHALHPRLARRLFGVLASLARRRRRQLIVPTHNPLVLDSLDLADDRVRLFAIERSTGGRSKISRIHHSEAIAKALESGLTISQMWTRGLLGAVPSL